ncbi:MAG: hypothetical protein C5B50_17285, partial [Verrucomicrobia bacterium]
VNSYTSAGISPAGRGALPRQGVTDRAHRRADSQVRLLRWVLPGSAGILPACLKLRPPLRPALCRVISGPKKNDKVEDKVEDKAESRGQDTRAPQVSV